MLFGRKKSAEAGATDQETIARWREFSRQTKEGITTEPADWPIPQANTLAREAHEEEFLAEQRERFNRESPVDVADTKKRFLFVLPCVQCAHWTRCDAI